MTIDYTVHICICQMPYFQDMVTGIVSMSFFSLRYYASQLCTIQAQTKKVADTYAYGCERRGAVVCIIRTKL